MNKQPETDRVVHLQSNIGGIVSSDMSTGRLYGVVAWGVCVVLFWQFIGEPFFWWLFKIKMIFFSDHQLRALHIEDPRRERLHIFFAAVLFVCTLVSIWASYKYAMYWGFVLSALGAVWYALLTNNYFSKEREDAEYPSSGSFE